MTTKLDGLGGPLVTVVIPTYNRADYIAETIESVLAQTYQPLQILVVDDGSTDHTREIVEPYTSRLRYVWQQNSERGACRNHGLRLAEGKYIAFLDSDDLWMPTKVEEDLNFLRNHPDAGVVYTDSIRIDSEGNDLAVVEANGPSGRVTATLLLRNFVSIGAHLVKTCVLQQIGGFREDRKLAGAEDWEMWVRLSLVTDFAYNPTATTKIRTHAENTMTNSAAMQRALGEAARFIHEEEKLQTAYKRSLKRMDANLALVNAINYCSQKEKKRSVRFLWNALSADPRIVFDLRYVYTLLRLFGVRGSPAQALGRK